MIFQKTLLVTLSKTGFLVEGIVRSILRCNFSSSDYFILINVADTI